MKRKFTIALVLTTLLMLLLVVSPVGAATRTISLLNAEVEEGETAGVFYFRVYGDFPKFSGTVYFGNTATKLNCNMQNNDKILICRMARGVPGIAGKAVTVEVNGFGFSTIVEINEENNCRPYYDWAPGPEGEGPWFFYGIHCEEGPIQEGVEYIIDNPYYGLSPYLLGPGGFCGPGGSYNNYGYGLYYVWCQNSPV